MAKVFGLKYLERANSVSGGADAVIEASILRKVTGSYKTDVGISKDSARLALF